MARRRRPDDRALDHLLPGERVDFKRSTRPYLLARDLDDPPPRRPGRPADAGVARGNGIRVPTTDAEKAELLELAAGRPLADVLRRAPARAAAWQAVADRLAEAVADPDGPGAEAALEAYVKLAKSGMRSLGEPPRAQAGPPRAAGDRGRSGRGLARTRSGGSAIAAGASRVARVPGAGLRR